MDATRRSIPRSEGLPPEAKAKDPSPRPGGVPGGLRWGVLGALLARKDLKAIRGHDRERLLALWQEIAQRERALEDRLTLGIIGGTGVGKSTLINAIAGAPISRWGDRRPTTSRVVVYHHRKADIPDGFPRDDLAVPPAVHDESGLERTLILDFPDFDSVEADHGAILARFLPLLDVLLVVVDEEKYGDNRLYEVLRSLPQAPRNLHFILNKVDRLAARYPGNERLVAREILGDLAWKLSTHAAIRAEPDMLLSVSARRAFERRIRDGERGLPGSLRTEETGGSGPDDPLEGDFAGVLGLLEGYRQEKRRRAAKSANLDARKGALARAARSMAFNPGKSLRSGALRQDLQERREELEGILEAAGPEAVAPRELRRIHGAAFRRVGPRLTFPLGWAAAIIQGKDDGGWPDAEGLTAQARAHYRPYREALAGIARELADEVSSVIRERIEPPVPAVAQERPGEELLSEIDRRLLKALRFQRLKVHGLPVLVVLLGIWLVVQPALARVARDLADGKSIDWTGAGAAALASCISALTPVGIASFLILLAGAYILSGLLDWRRIRRAVDGSVGLYGSRLREEAREEGRRVLGAISASLEAWERDCREMEDALGG